MVLAEITDEILRNAVQAQDANEFDSHDVIFWIARNRPREYASDLQRALVDAGDPFMNLHSVIAQRLAALPDLVDQLHRKRTSISVRGEETECEVWRRVTQPNTLSLSPRHEQLRQHLAGVAGRRKLIHYAEVADMLGIVADRLDHCPELAQSLDEISTFEHGDGRPLLSVVVVRKEDKRPGGGFFKMAKQNGVQSPGADDDEFYVAELNRAWDYWEQHRDSE